MVCDSHRTKPSSSIVGTSEFGFICMYSGVFVTPCSMPASVRSYLRPSSSAAQSAFLTFTELVRPQIFNIWPPSNDPQVVASQERPGREPDSHAGGPGERMAPPQ